LEVFDEDRKEKVTLLVEKQDEGRTLHLLEIATNGEVTVKNERYTKVGGTPPVYKHCY
jgi:hypothetical protein